MAISTKRREQMPAEKFAFPKERKEPLNDASHVRNAIARFDQVEGVSDSEREAAWRRIRSAAKKVRRRSHRQGLAVLDEGRQIGPKDSAQAEPLRLRGRVIGCVRSVFLYRESVALSRLERR